LVNFVSGVLLLTIVQFSKKKPFGRQFVTNQLGVDLAFIILATITLYVWTIIFKETFGPLEVVPLNVLWALMQFLQLMVSMYMISIQTAQFVSIFCTAW